MAVLPRIRVLNTNRRERSVARNTGAAVSKGQFLHFLDDDDILLPGALRKFWRFSKETDAAWLYGAYQTVDNDGNLINEFHPNLFGNIFALLVAGESLPLQASLLKADRFHAVGGFDMTPKIIGVEDRDLGRRFASENKVSFLPEIVARIRIGEVSSTTNWSTIAKSDRFGREKALNLSSAISHINSSAVTAYWHGRVSKAYCGSMVWNLKRKNISIFNKPYLGIGQNSRNKCFQI